MGCQRKNLSFRIQNMALISFLVLAWPNSGLYDHTELRASVKRIPFLSRQSKLFSLNSEGVKKEKRGMHPSLVISLPGIS